jgi:hypothetical protein
VGDLGVGVGALAGQVGEGGHGVARVGVLDVRLHGGHELDAARVRRGEVADLRQLGAVLGERLLERDARPLALLVEAAGEDEVRRVAGACRGDRQLVRVLRVGDEADPRLHEADLARLLGRLGVRHAALHAGQRV